MLSVLEAEGGFEVCDFNDVSFVQFALADDIFSVDPQSQFFLGRADEIFVVAFADQGSSFWSKEAFQPDRRHVGLADHGHLARQNILFLIGLALQHAQDTDAFLGGH